MNVLKRTTLAAASLAALGGFALAPSASAAPAPTGSVSSADSAQVAADAAPEAKLGAKAKCGGNMVVTAVKYSPSKSNCNVAGHKGFKLGIKFTSTDSYSAVQLKGYDKNGKAYWKKCGAGNGKCTVNWGNMLGKPEVRGWNAVRPATVYWQHA